MDQESFRKLLQVPSARPTTSAQAPVATSKAPKGKTKKNEAAGPAFKPRAVKKNDESYRDRAEERRLGLAHDYAQVEALAEDFEKRNADKDRATLEEQRRYLGGDSEHTVLVKGLDFSLLEQNKARAAASTEDDELLEQVFEEVQATLPTKRTREEIITDLKNKRHKSEGAFDHAESVTPGPSIEQAKKAGKFKPIGFKPIGPAEGTKKKVKKVKKVKVKNGKETEKLRGTGTAPESSSSAPVQQDEPEMPPATKAPPPRQPEPESLEEDFDIFAGVGEYTGIDLGPDDDEEDESDAETVDKRKGKDKKREEEIAKSEEQLPVKANWFDTEDEPVLPGRPSTPSILKSNSPSVPLPPEEKEEGEEEEDEKPARLAPLASSAMPSVRDYLAMEAEAEREEKRRAKKEKKKKAA